MSESENNQVDESTKQSEQTPQTEQPPMQQKKRPLTDVERAQLKRQRDVELRRRMQELREATSAEEREEVYKEVHFERKNVLTPTTPKGKWENYWYHYKGATILITFLALLVALFVYDMVTQPKYDVDMMMVTNLNYFDTPEQLDKLKNNLNEHIEDYDENGEKLISLQVLNLNREDPDSVDPNLAMANTTKITVSMAEADLMIYLVDENYYEHFKESGVKFMDLSELSDNPNIDGERYAVRDDADFASLNGKDDIYLVFRSLEGLADKDKEKVIEQHAKQIEAVKKIIAE